MIFALAITGPTASGKTALSIELAKRLGCEIISCDSMQIYRGMDIGTAKATADEQNSVRHHLIDFLSPAENYSAEAYRADAMAVAEDINSRGLIPLFAGGTGLYVDTLMRAPSIEVPKSSKDYNSLYPESEMSEEEREIRREELWQRLSEVDAESAAAIHKNNVRRVIRALEIYDLTGKPKSYFDKLSREKNPSIRIGMITLDFHNRDTLYSRVDLRVDKMMEEGLLKEVRELYEKGLLPEDSTAAQAIGYKEIIRCLKGEISLPEAVELIKLSSRRYAKRQLTWFRHENDAYRLYLDTEDGVMRDGADIISEAVCAAQRFVNN